MSEPYRAGVALVTGASGFIGGRLRDALLADGYDVVALTRKGSPEPKKGRGAPVDYADLESLERVIEKERPEYVFHVAGATKGVKYQDFQRANVMPTENLLKATKRVHPGIRRFLHVSSLTCYGPSTVTRPSEEDDERKPVELYGTSKLEAEQVVDAASKDVPVTIIRPPAVYGPGDVDAFELFRWAARRLNLFYGNRDVMMSYVYVDDLVRGMRDAAAHDATLAKGYFLCDGEPRTWGGFQGEIVKASGLAAFDLNLPLRTLDVAAFFGELATMIDGKPRLFNKQKALLGKQLAWTCRSDRARADFGYKPQVDVREGVERTFEWYRAQRWI
jgi:nucleoside-diphosphate-sugar epimerase